MVVPESMAMLKPVIGIYTSGITKQIDNSIAGFLFDPGNVKNLTDKLSFLIGNSNPRLSMGNAEGKNLKNTIRFKVTVNTWPHHTN